MTADQDQYVRRATNAAIHIGLLGLLAVWCLRILLPFLSPVAWAIILAISTRPLHLRLTALLGGRNRVAAAGMALAALALLITPATVFSVSVVESAQRVAVGLEEGTLTVPAPPEGVEDWPLVGARLNAFWTLASTDLDAALEQSAPELRELASRSLALAAATLKDVLFFALSIVIAGFLLGTASSGTQVVHSIGRRLGGDRGDELVELAQGTIRSVAQGVVGIALIQAAGAWIGMVVVGVPGAAVWALLVLLIAVMQLPPILVLGPVMVYVFSSHETLPAVLFLIWGLVVSGSDTFLKPLLLGRGLDVPMLVILLGAIGGMVTAGIIGLFVGAVVLALGYQLFRAWLKEGIEAAPGPVP